MKNKIRKIISQLVELILLLITLFLITWIWDDKSKFFVAMSLYFIVLIWEMEKIKRFLNKLLEGKTNESKL